jgi:Na+-driven multidrug efflux pump
MDTLLLKVFRQFVVIVAAFALLSAVFHRLSVLWAAVPITEVISVILAWFLYRRTMQDVERSIPQPNR